MTWLILQVNWPQYVKGIKIFFLAKVVLLVIFCFGIKIFKNFTKKKKMFRIQF